MSDKIIERFQRLYPDLERLTQRLTERLQELNSEVGEQVRGQDRIILVRRDEKPYLKLKKLLEKDLVLAELDGVNRLARGYPLMNEHISALEAIIDEAMPFLVIRDGDFELPNDWKKNLEAEHASMRKTVAAVGRIASTGSKLYWGTGFLVAPDIIMTNWHVIYGHAYPENDTWEFYPHLDVKIDFHAEYQTQEPFKVRCVQIIGRHPKYDLALLRTEREITEISPLILSSQSSQDSKPLPIYLVGHPYIDSRLGANFEVQCRLFLMGQTFGYKHLLLGYTEPIVPYQPAPKLDCPKMSYFCHTGSTLPGNSGSCVVDIQTHKVIGLHCAGDNIAKRNYAVPLWMLKEDKLFQEAGGIRFA